MTHFDIPPYLDFLSEELLHQLVARAEAVEEIPGLKVQAGLRAHFPRLETAAALTFTCEVYQAVKGHLRQVLEQRKIDRAFIDETTLNLVVEGKGKGWLDPDYPTVLTRRNAQGQVVVGPDTREGFSPRPVLIPPFLRGDQVTLFGPPDTTRMSINAMNALHRRLPGESPLVEELVASSGQVARWGADDEDSKTPIMADFLTACENLMGCFDGSLSFTDPESGRHYRLEDRGLSLPIKRIPGLALPDASHLLDGNPLPLHLLDFALHLFHNWQNPRALIFYVPKLETGEEASYLHHLIQVAEAGIQRRFPSYQLGSVGLFVVFENPRAIFRIQEIADNLWPHFLGGSLGWHDFLASTARLFRHEPHYQIPVKADPNIVINRIKESHRILVRELAPLGAIAIGGMYGVLYEEGNPQSFQVSMVGYIKDVVTQLKRGLDGFWVAHPNFVRIGLALVAAWRRQEQNPSDTSLERLISALVPDDVELVPLLSFVRGQDVPGLDVDNPLYLRGVLAADLVQSEVIPNYDPEEVRYNIFQALQYLADWLRGNGCVALPARMTNTRGESVFVRIMDDLATTERSRWEVWAEVHHGRVSREEFERILAEEVAFIQAGVETPARRIQVKWQGSTARWYPVAIHLLRQLMTDPHPVEFVTQLLLPFTLDIIRHSDDPWSQAKTLCPGRYR